MMPEGFSLLVLPLLLFTAMLFIFLQGGVVIVDSPGVCDSEQVSKIVLQYLPQAYAFIYVINSPNAGGIQEDRVSQIKR